MQHTSRYQTHCDTCVDIFCLSNTLIFTTVIWARLTRCYTKEKMNSLTWTKLFFRWCTFWFTCVVVCILPEVYRYLSDDDRHNGHLLLSRAWPESHSVWWWITPTDAFFFFCDCYQFIFDGRLCNNLLWAVHLNGSTGPQKAMVKLVGT